MTSETDKAPKVPKVPKAVKAVKVPKVPKAVKATKVPKVPKVLKAVKEKVNTLNNKVIGGGFGFMGKIKEIITKIHKKQKEAEQAKIKSESILSNLVNNNYR